MWRNRIIKARGKICVKSVMGKGGRKVIGQRKNLCEREI